MDKQPLTVVWLRRDLRLDDNLALSAAQAEPLLIVITKDGLDLAERGAASRAFLKLRLQHLQEELWQKFKLKPYLSAKPLLETLGDLQDSFSISRVLWQRDYQPLWVKRDGELEQKLKQRGIPCKILRGNALFEPWALANKQGEAYRVFTPYFKAFLQQQASILAPLPAPKQLFGPSVESEDLQAWIGDPKPPWHQPMLLHWRLDEKAVLEKVQAFLQSISSLSVEQRDQPASEAVSRLSPYLHLGVLSVRRLWQASQAYDQAFAVAFRRQIVWREFAMMSLYHFPKLAQEPLYPMFAHYPWREDPEALAAWSQGRTGYPLVDAGMRELWASGFMHNRLRMVTASFLVKNLGIAWQTGAAHFWDCLVDADLAQNSMGWQWVAGCGIDPSPFFRIFNPIVQSQKFDPDAAYIKRWVPELRALPAEQCHAPWLHAKARDSVLLKDYPYPIVDFAQSRMQTLMSYERLKQSYTRK